MSNLQKKVAIIGLGNCGSQVAYLAERKYGDLFDSVYINSSDADLSMVGDSRLKFKLGEEDVEGSGKNRSVMKQYLKEGIGKILGNETFQETIADKQYVFIVSSAAGGTGSGAAPVMMSIMKEMFIDVNFILVAVLPQQQASLMEIGNAREYCDELYRNLAETSTYMIYDNDTASDLSATQSLTTVNEAIVEDIRVLTGVDNYPTPYESIDEADMESILTTPGRLIVARVTKGLTEKIMEDAQIDDILIKAIKLSRHAETNRDKKHVRCGVITFFTEEVNRLYGSSLEKLFDFIGTPIERFNHNAVNPGAENMNFIYLIAAGLSPITDRIRKMDDRAEALQRALANSKAGEYVASEELPTYSVMGERRKQARRQGKDDDINLNDIFSKF